MKNGYSIFWTDLALNELEKTIQYLEENWTEKELRNLALKLEKTLSFRSQNPNLFQVAERDSASSHLSSQHSILSRC